MRLAFFDDRSPQPYGAQINLMLLAEQCRDAGHEVEMMVTSGSLLTEACRSRDLPVKLVPAPGRLVRTERTIFEGRILDHLRTVVELVGHSWRLDRIVRADPPDLIVANSVRAMLQLWLTGALRRPRVILWAQSDRAISVASTVAGLLSWRIGLISDAAANTFKPTSQRFYRRRFRAMPPGRDFSLFPVSIAPSADELRIVTVCSLTPRKGIHRMFRAIHAIDRPNIRVTVVGGTVGPKSEKYASELREQAATLELEVDFVGWQDDVVPYLRNADVFVLASSNEGLPGALLEAMGCGVPCIATRAGDSGTLIEAADAGITVAIGDRRALTEALRHLADDPHLRREAGHRGSAYVRKHYSLGSMYNGFIAITDEARPR